MQWEIKTFQIKLPTSFISRGEIQQHLDMKGYSESGKAVAAKEMLTSFLQMSRLCWIVFMVCINVDVGTGIFAQPEVHFLVLSLYPDVKPPLISRYVKGIYNKHQPLPKCVNEASSDTLCRWIKEELSNVGIKC